MYLFATRFGTNHLIFIGGGEGEEMFSGLEMFLFNYAILSFYFILFYIVY